MEKQRFDPILFDLDGTLVDSSIDLAEAINHTLGAFSLPPLQQKEIIGFVGDGARRLIEKTLARAGKPEHLEPALIHFKKDYRNHCLVHTAAYPGIPELLAALQTQGARIGVVTNKPVEFARLILGELGLLEHVRALVGGDETERLKPFPDPVLLCLKRLQAIPEHGLMVGDHSNDVLAGRASGLSTCGVLWGFDRGVAARAASPDHLCQIVEDLSKLLVSP
jgi:phosphoglycolate phosphatase